MAGDESLGFYQMTASAKAITRKAGSNLAFTFSQLPSSRRRGIEVLYAYCRTIDDLADDSERAKQERVDELHWWRAGILDGFAEERGLSRALAEVIDEFDLDRSLVVEVINGCLRDLNFREFGTFEDLRGYCFQVAGSVGLVSLPIFGCTSEASQAYARALGEALQVTNILRDVREDLAHNGRIYLPTADMSRFQYTQRDLVGLVYDGRFVALMEFECQRAVAAFRQAEEIFSNLSGEEQNCLVAAQAMAKIYHKILGKMRKDQFQVFNKRYRVSNFEKFIILFSQRLKGGGGQ